jgi:hypothetical protein
VRKAAIVLEIIEWLKREPLSCVLLTRTDSVVDSQLQEQFFDVKGRKELPLSVYYDLSRWLSRNREEWLHDFWVWISDTLSLSGVEALVDVRVSEVVLSNNLHVLRQRSQVFFDLLDGFSLSLFQT